MAASDDPTASYAQRIPADRPTGLRLSTARQAWYRVDAGPPDGWSWRAYAKPRNRFDPAAGSFRVRYAGDARRVAMRERFDISERRVDGVALRSHLIELSGTIQVVDLRRDRTLDALGLDDQISTSRALGVWTACHQFADRIHDWFGERCDGIVYRSRTTPQHSANLAFFAHAPLRARDLGVLADQEDLLLECVTQDGFTIQAWR